MEIRDCNFMGVKWDEPALESVKVVAQALLNLTKLFISSNIQIDCLLKVESPEKVTPPQKKVKS